jgi:hypothetical protein
VDSADANYRIQRFESDAAAFIGNGHRDRAVVRKRVLRQLAVTGFEYVKRQQAVRKEHHAA